MREASKNRSGCIFFLALVLILIARLVYVACLPGHLSEAGEVLVEDNVKMEVSLDRFPMTFSPTNGNSPLHSGFWSREPVVVQKRRAHTSGSTTSGRDLQLLPIVILGGFRFRSSDDMGHHL